MELYSLAKPRNQKIDKSKDEVEYERNCDECTFVPDIKITKTKRVTSNTSEYLIKDVDKVVERMKKARE